MLSRALLRPPTSSLALRPVFASPARLAHSFPSPSSPTRACPSCQSPIPLPLSPCSKCSSLLPLPSDMSHHSVLYLSSPTAASARGPFDLPKELEQLKAHGFGVDKKELRGNWLQRQSALHPDKFGSKGEQAVHLARELSGRVNEAYAVLGDDLRRAEYILSIYAKDTQETDKLDDPMLLMEVLEAREELEEAESQEEIDRIRSSNHEKVSEITQALTAAFSETPPKLDEAKVLAVQLKYWMGLEKAAKDKIV
ncbi:Fe-S protein assembly co-chaperone HscB [Cryptococcus amylolentus CBS 6273]|uniref:Fe-S protein assembly co-chaperone HscB n=1 Tax=Cryptococcus amylolentus CBS 6273 TaxID=1296118 RepID=A0A1E3K0L5_9TREE|nr:Fe-S protein assembly co-chaperone HscB [Cryptococcus amylolentus CBS 6273]